MYKVTFQQQPSLIHAKNKIYMNEKTKHILQEIYYFPINFHEDGGTQSKILYF